MADRRGRGGGGERSDEQGRGEGGGGRVYTFGFRVCGKSKLVVASKVGGVHVQDVTKIHWGSAVVLWLLRRMLHKYTGASDRRTDERGRA